MDDQNPVPLVILSAARDPVELINSILRRAGHPVHCTWIPSLRDLADGLTQLNPELILFADTGSLEDLFATADVRDQFAPTVPILSIAEKVDEVGIAAAIQHGARDVVSLTNPARLQAVMTRELRSFRLERALESTLKAARDTRNQLETVLQRSNDAIVQVQEGIVVEANDSWLELFGYVDDSSLIGQPVMDLFEESNQAAIKGAIAACLQGKWNDLALKANGLLADGSTLAVELLMTLGEYEGSPCVRVVVPARPRDDRRLAEELAETMRRDPATGLLHRRTLLEAISARIATAASAGVRYIAVIRPDRFSTVEQDVGVTASEDVFLDFVRELKGHLNPKDIIGRFAGLSFVVLLERGNSHDVEAWAEQLVSKIAKHIIKVDGKSLSVTCSVGTSAVAPNAASIDPIISDALEACRRAQKRGGNQSLASEDADADSRVQSYDKIWVKHIKAALMENRFRLVQQPVASLHGDDPNMFDVLVRMLDQQGKEVLPAEFMAAAERNDLLKNIDRWVVGASLSFAAQRKPGCLFVRLSRDSIRDASFLEWLVGHIKSSRAEPQRLCFQANETVAASHLTQVRVLASELKQHGFRFALENFGSGRDPVNLIETIPLDFIKVDGALMQGLATNADNQQRVRMLVEAAKERRIETIAERVEDANTMAVLWQLGVQYIQGYFVNAPEQVTLKG